VIGEIPPKWSSKGVYPVNWEYPQNRGARVMQEASLPIGVADSKEVASCPNSEGDRRIAEHGIVASWQR
jgi:hypothetical protein